MDTIDTLLMPIEADAPCGPNLEYDAAFLALETLAAPRGERAIGDTVKQAEEPEWRDVARQAEQLATRTHDLRVAIHLATARLRTEGWEAWAATIAHVRGLLERYWDDVHPTLDDGDAMERVSALAALSAPEAMLGHLRQAPLLAAERVGAFSLRDLRVLSGALKPGDGISVVTQEHVDAVMQQVDTDALVRLHAAVVGALDDARAIAATFDERTPGTGPELDPLLRDLREVQAFLQPYLAMRAPASVEGVAPVSEEPGAVAATTADARGPIRGTADVVRLLDEICAWYATHEPSSPIPALLQRAKGLVGLGFTDLLKALAPGGLSEFQVLAGDGD